MLSPLLALSMSLVALTGSGLSVFRHLLLYLTVARKAQPAGADLQHLVRRLAAALKMAPPRVLLHRTASPLALTYGITHPTVVLSPWMIDQLDHIELEAVLAHELAHIARRDALFGWLAQLLRDAFCYLPTSWVAYRHLQDEKELASDDLALQLTHRPLGLASALAKVWQEAVHLPSFSTGPALVGMQPGLENRITRLLYPQAQANDVLPARWQSLGSVLLALVGLVVIEASMIAVLLATMGCGPLVLS